MNDGDVVLSRIQQSDGTLKTRPVVLLKSMPPYGDFLACGVSTKINKAVEDFDELLLPGDVDYISSGVKYPSLIRLGYLGLVPKDGPYVLLGAVSAERHFQLLLRLSRHLQPAAAPGSG